MTCASNIVMTGEEQIYYERTTLRPTNSLRVFTCPISTEIYKEKKIAKDKSSFDDEIVWSRDAATSSVKYTPPSLCTPVLRQHSPL